MGDRHQFRAKWHDYNGGVFFVTICSWERTHVFGRIFDKVFYPTELGKIVIENLNCLPSYYTDVELLNAVVMPNHIHLFIASAEGNKKNLGCLKQSEHGEECKDFHHNSRLASIIGAFKAGVTRTARTRKIASVPY